MICLDLSDLPEVGAAEFLAALTAPQQLEMNNLPDDDARRAFQVTLRETTIANRRRDHAALFPLSDSLMSLIFLVQADLNEQQRERFVSSMNIRQIALPQYTYLQVKQLFLELFCVSLTGVADPNIAHRKRHTFYIIEEGETEDGEKGFWVVDEETGEEGFTGLYTDTEFWVLGFRPRSKGKGYAAWDNDQQDAAFWQKGKGKRGTTGFMKGKDPFKGMPWKSGNGKGKDNKGGKQAFPSQPQPENLAQTPASSTAPPEKQEPAQSEEGWGYDNDTYWTDDWSTWNTYDYDVDYAQDNA
eukprot:s690_g23.t1